MIVTKEIEINDEEVLVVNFKIEGSYGNLGIGSYEYWGFRGNDVRMGWEIDEMSYDEAEYTPEQRLIINKYLENHIDSLEDEFIKRMKDD